jgi:hypothetical protein
MIRRAVLAVAIASAVGTGGAARHAHGAEAVKAPLNQPERVGDITLTLAAETCVLQWQRQDRPDSLTLAMPPPCQLHRNKDRLRIKTVGRVHYVLIESSRPHPELPRDCITFVRSLRIEGTDVKVSPHMTKAAACPPFQWDDMMFTALFE